MSIDKVWSLTKALEERSPIPIVSQACLGNGEDFIPSFVNKLRSGDTGYKQFKLDSHLYEKTRSKRSDFNPQQNSEFVQKIETVQLGSELIGCQRKQIGRTQVGQVLGNSELAIGDVSIHKFVERKDFVNLFSLLNINSVLSEEALGQKVGGFTHPTIQLSGGPCVLPFHIEHWAAYSVNYLHWGEPNVWYIIAPHHYIPAMHAMKRLQGSQSLGEYHGVCQDTCSHRDMIYDNHSLKKEVDVQVIVQMPGEVMVLPPFALHSVQKLGTNCAESQNFLPAKFLPLCAAYKTCFHSEGVMGKPLFNHFTYLFDNLYRSGKIKLKDFIHSSDPNKTYKLRVVKKIKKAGNKGVLAEVVQHIMHRATNAEWFQFIVPMDVEDQQVSNRGKAKYYTCPACSYSTHHHHDLRTHIKRIHGDTVKVPENTKRVKCPICGTGVQELRKHIGRQKCINLAKSKSNDQ